MNVTLTSFTAAFYTIFSVGQGFGSLAASVYVLDAHRERAADCFVMITLYKVRCLATGTTGDKDKGVG